MAGRIGRAEAHPQDRDSRLFNGVYRYRLIDEENGGDLGPFVSLRLAFATGETIGRAPGERFTIVNVVAPENENFRAYLIVRRL